MSWLGKPEPCRENPERSVSLGGLLVRIPEMASVSRKLPEYTRKGFSRREKMRWPTYNLLSLERQHPQPVKSLEGSSARAFGRSLHEAARRMSFDALSGYDSYHVPVYPEFEHVLASPRPGKRAFEFLR